MNHSTSGKYEQLFPHEETGNDNRVLAGKEYMVPATEAAFRIAGPPGHEILYWMVTPARLIGKGIEYQPLPPPPPPDRQNPKNMTPRCDDAMLRARGDCIDTSAGAQTARGGAASGEPRGGSRRIRAIWSSCARRIRRWWLRRFRFPGR